MTKDGHVGAIHMVCESIAEVPASILRIRWEERSAAPISTIYSHVNVGSVLEPGPDDIPHAGVVHEYEATSYGTRMRSTFIFPADTPQQFLDALRKHDIEEMAQFPKFLPELYQQNVG